jgi:hypothetical protein
MFYTQQQQFEALVSNCCWVIKFRLVFFFCRLRKQKEEKASGGKYIQQFFSSGRIESR